MDIKFKLIKSLLSTILVVFTLITFGQEDCYDGIDNDGDGLIDLNDPDGCDCASESELEFVLNGDFESFTTCPNQFSQLPVVTGYYISQGGTSDYYNTCGFMGGNLYPDVSDLIQPENGEGIIGFYSSPSSSLDYREYVATCLDGTLIPGEVYTLSFDLATTGESSTGEIGAIEFLNCSALTVGLFGSTDCPLELGFLDYTGCISNFSPSYITILEEEISVEVNEFTTYTFEFTVPQPITNVVFGGGCSEPSCSGPGSEAYFYLDNLSITQIVQDSNLTPALGVTGNSCEGFFISAEDQTFESYQWFENGIAIEGETAPSLSIDIDVPTEITLGVFINEDGVSSCSFSDPVQLTLEPEIVLTADFPETLCENETAEVSLDISPTGNYDIIWNTNESSESIEASAGLYTVEVTNTLTGCSNSLEFEILPCEPGPLQISLDDFSICAGEETIILGDVSGGIAPYTYEWSPFLGTGPGPYTVTPSEEVTYELTVIDAEGTSATELLTIGVVDPSNFVIDLGSDTTLCADELFEIGPNTLLSDVDYFWNTGQDTPFIEVNASGTYQLSFETICGFFSDEIEVTISNDLEFPFISDEFLNCEDTPLTLSIPQDEGFSAFWENGETAIERTFTESGQYAITFESDCDSLTNTFTVDFVECECEVYIPNAFTPNQDGLNEVFEVSINCEPESYLLRIFNRWGEEVFSSTNPQEPWRGDFERGDYYNGVAVFNYILEIQPANSPLFVTTPAVYKGSVTLLR